VTGPADVPRLPRRRGVPLESPATGVTVFEVSAWFVTVDRPRPPVTLIEDADPDLAGLAGDDYVTALCEHVAAAHHVPDPYMRPVLPPPLEGRFLVDLPRLIRFMERNHRDGGGTPTGHAAMTAILMTLADLSGAV
jgi:hypothetical protein